MALDAQTEALLKRLHAAPEDEALMQHLRERLLEQGQRKTLIKLLQWRARKLQAPDRSAAMLLEAGGLLKQARGNLAEVLAIYQKIETLRVDDRWRALGLHAQASATVDLGGPRHQAIDLLERAVVFDPNLDHATALLAQLLESAADPKLRTRAANLYTRLGERGGGEPYFRRALSIHPTSELALAHLEVALLKSGQGDELVPLWERFVAALERRAGTASKRAEAHVRCQLATHLSQQGEHKRARELLHPVRDAGTPSVVALLEELEGMRDGDASQVAFLAALEDVEDSEITSEDAAIALSNPPVWEPVSVESDYPGTAPAALPMHFAPEGLEAEKTHRKADESPAPVHVRQSAPTPPRRSSPGYQGWAPPEGSAPIIEVDPDDERIVDKRAMRRLFPTDEASQQRPQQGASKGHVIEVVHFHHETALSVHSLQGRYRHPKIEVRHVGSGARVSFPRGFSNANHSKDGRAQVLTPGSTHVDLGFGDRLDTLIGNSRFTVSVRPVAIAPSATANIPWKRHFLSAAGSFAVHLTMLLGLALIVMLGAAPPVVDTRPQAEIYAEAKLKPPPVDKPKPKPKPVPTRLTKKKAPKPEPDRQVRIPKSLRKTLRRISKSREESSKSATERAVSALRTPLGGEGQTLSEAVTNLDAVKGGEASGAFRVGGTLAALDSKGVNIASGGGGDIGTLRAGSATKNLDKLSKRSGQTRGRVRSIAALSKVQGSLSRGEVMAVINRNIGKIQRCYEQGLARRDSLAGRVEVKWTIAPTGRVSTARQAGSTLGDRKVENCVVGVVKQMKFPKPSGGPVSVTFPFVFQKG